ncbi:hypothetical protein [Acinetobacter tianfuensis]|uniref:SinR family protein n=1 Tax=Acinetobacter tianfuensis TaxID=2419603 RepID=A0A3A8E246_9GAMM|nr:hypothetical protein [Acinetobacter tianfuensis]RKG29252.1 hypothetical protein D7V32_15805 [Acinetobacter tianfuensis]
MTTYLISLEARSKRDYDDLAGKIGQISTDKPIAPLKNLWVMHSDLSSEEIRDQLLSHIYAKDALMVIRVDAQNWASWNIHEKSAHWLNQSIS